MTHTERATLARTELARQEARLLQALAFKPHSALLQRLLRETRAYQRQTDWQLSCDLGFIGRNGRAPAVDAECDMALHGMMGEAA